MASEISARADFTGVRYAQCWEDADVLVEALGIGPGARVLSIASAGDNSFAMLARGAARVLAVDLSPAQIACVEIRAAMYRQLVHAEFLELYGSRPSARRRALYARVRPGLSADAAAFWDAHDGGAAAGVGAIGKFERYFSVFRRFVLPLVHRRSRRDAILSPRSREERVAYYRDVWDNRRWRALFRIFFSRTVMGRAGRDPEFFRYVEGDVAGRILTRARYALTELDPTDNPYLQWILTGGHPLALPFALRPGNYDAIRENLGALEWRCCALEDVLDAESTRAFDAFNLSDIFEYMSEQAAAALLARIADAGRPGARLAYWNMLVPRRRPEALSHRLVPLEGLAAQLFVRDKAFFYSALVVEEVAP